MLVQYLACVLVSPMPGEDAPVDLVAFHWQQAPRYLLAFGLLNTISVPLNIATASLFRVSEWGWQNLAQGRQPC